MKIKLFIIVFFAGFALNLLNSQNRDTLGDVNGDGNINVLDIIRIVNIILENDPPPTEYELWAGDVNFDESVDVTDIIILINYIIGVGVLCDYGYSFCPGSTTECCADISSHEFTWEIDTIGLYGSILRDTYIVDENNIWAVGNIETNDGEYNAAHWDGIEWNYLEIINTADLYSIHYLAEDDVWVTTFGLPIHWDGNDWTLYHIQQMGIDASPGRACWGTSSSDMYFVGYQGAIVHYDGDTFEQMESGTDTDLLDVQGTSDGSFVFAAGYNVTGESVALMYDGAAWTQLYAGEHYHVGSTSIYGRINCVEISADTAYFATTAGLLKFVIPDSTYILTAEDQGSFSDYHFVDISMNTTADMMLISRVFSFLHYNGESWYHDESVADVQSTWAKGGMLRGDTCITVGYCCWGDHAYIARGYR